MEPEPQRFLRVKEVSLILNLSRRSIYRLIEEGDLPAYSFTSETYQIDPSDLKKFIESRKIS